MVAAKQRRPRRFRYSLRALLVLMLLSGFAFAWVHRAQQQRAAVEALRESNPGATVSYDEPGRANRANQNSIKLWLRDRLGADYVTSVSSVRLSYPTDADLQRVALLPRLRRLTLCRAIDVTDDGLAHLSTLAQLDTLVLYEADQVTDAGLNHLAQLTTLKKLTLGLGRTRVTDSGIEALRRALPNCKIEIRASASGQWHELAHI